MDWPTHDGDRSQEHLNEAVTSADLTAAGPLFLEVQEIAPLALPPSIQTPHSHILLCRVLLSPRLRGELRNHPVTMQFPCNGASWTGSSRQSRAIGLSDQALLDLTQHV